MPGLLYAYDLVLYIKSEEELRVMVGQFAEVKVIAGKSKVMVLKGEEGLECEVHVDGIRSKHVSEFKYLGCVLDKSGTDGAECNRKVASGRMVEGGIRSLVNVGIYSLSVLEFCMRHCLCLFLHMAVRKCCGKRRRNLE